MKFDTENITRVLDVSQEFDNIVEFSIETYSNYKINGKKWLDGTYVIGVDYKNDVFVNKPIQEYEGELIPYYFGVEGVEIIPEKYVKLWRNFFQYSVFILRYLNVINEKQRIEKNAIEYFQRELDLSIADVSILLKILIGQKHINYVVRGKKKSFELTTEQKKVAEKNEFLATILEEIKSKSRRIGLLINHGGTVGNYRETLLKNTLQKYIPAKYSISSGFIEGIPRQIDIIIYDSHNFIPLFKEDNLVVVKIEAVRAVIEVKSSLNNKELKEALDIINEISSNNFKKPIIPIFKGIFAYDTKIKTVKP